MSTRDPYILRSQDSITILQIPAIYQLDEMGGVRDLHRRSSGKRGCSKCRQRRQRPGYLAPSVGAGLIRAIRNGHSDLLYNALSAEYSIKGPIQLDIGPCKSILKG
jgi:hypothetical protein